MTARRDESRPVGRFVSWLRCRRFVVIDLEGATVDEFRAPQEVRIFLRREIDPNELAVLIYERGKRVGRPMLGRVRA